MSRLAALTLVVLAVLLRVAGTPAPVDAASPPRAVPVLAYYYIWYQESSWNRAKTDYPLLGRYSSDDAEVMRQHVQWAKGAGIEGFIVSWKHTESLDARLAQLIEVAGEEDFKLAIIYQGLDFGRRPLPVAIVEADLRYFADNFADEPVFDIFEKPLVIWSGTWEFSPANVGAVASVIRPDMLLLASERKLQGYAALADTVDGNAYYWSSVNPQTHPGYEEKLAALADAAHEPGGLWIAPAAIGFDARLVGGTRVVPRDAENIQRQYEAALGSSPDAVGLISWNEFSENSHIEPSTNDGSRLLDSFAELRNLPALGLVSDSSDIELPASAGDDSSMSRLVALAGVGLLLVGGVALSVGRTRRSPHRPAD